MNTDNTLPDFPCSAKSAANGTLGSEALAHTCPTHGKPTKRASCRACNAAYQRGYLQRRRRLAPEKEMWRRCRERARRLAIAFEIPDDLTIPRRCPALGVPLTPGGRRSATSPSLDRINPDIGYLPGNVRIISDRANRLKGNHSLDRLRMLSTVGSGPRRAEFCLIVRYIEREHLLGEVRRLAESGPGKREEWAKVAAFLERAFAKGHGFTALKHV